MTDTPPVIVWMRRDLRLQDNLALAAAIHSGKQVIPLFVFDPRILKSERVGVPRLKFMLAGLESIRTDLHKHQRELLVRHGDPVEVIPQVMQEANATGLYFNIDYTPYARKRDEAVKAAVQQEVHTFHDRLLAPPGTVQKNAGGPYSVYTPFKNKWRELIKPDQTADYPLTASEFHDLSGIKNDGLPSLDDLGFASTIDVPEAGETEAHRRLDHFMEKPIYAYDDARNRLGNPHDDPHTGTSFLSPYIRFGMISPRHIYWRARTAYSNTNNDAKRESVVSFVDEIIWHEFYTHVLWFFPKVETDNFQEKYDAVQWEQNAETLQAWKDGCTGYPVVDAAMRQLKGTGWMHNRARMIVASFLTKDLLIDWREGEKHFMQWLLDGDLAANNGGWQWAAGTGTDAQPYFRIFNPVSQSKKFDPDGTFIRHWVPELRDVPDKYIHEPWKMTTPPADYPAPIVDHKAARERTLEAFAVVKGK